MIPEATWVNIPLSAVPKVTSRGTDGAFDPFTAFPPYTGSKKASRAEPIFKKASASYYWEALYKIDIQEQFCNQISIYAHQSNYSPWGGAINLVEYNCPDEPAMCNLVRNGVVCSKI